MPTMNETTTPPPTSTLLLQQHDDDDDDDDNNDDFDVVNKKEEAFCSVLNIVVDHIMVSPTPMEPEEFHATHPSSSTLLYPQPQPQLNHTTVSSNIQVPLMRIFGPILRTTTPSSSSSTSHNNNDTKQSACLYVHGAFPYLLARPVVAGPDGSMLGPMGMIQTTNNNNSNNNNSGLESGGVDWDRVESVQRILPMLQTHLEATLQQHSFSTFDNNDDHHRSAANNNKKQQQQQQQVKMIRRISVVVGRGFYSYCPGPPAPFLRVEYYNPKMRWKVKLILERGIPDLPRSYHPDPQQYGYPSSSSSNHHTSDKPDNDNNDNNNVLRFHCYEAHIPYSVQFFKDYNLAGMSFLHLAKDGVKFRHSLPKKVQHRWDSSDDSTTTTCTNVSARQQQQQQNNFFLESTVDPPFMWELPTKTTTTTCRRRQDSTEENNPQQHSTILFPAEPPITLGESHTEFHLSSLQQSSGSSQAPSQEESVNRGNSSFYLENFAARSMEVSPPPQQQVHQGGIIIDDHLSKDDDDDDDDTLDWFWTKKETSCDVELDVSVQHILNVQDVMTSLPDDQQEREQIHWRAVPSLREIWRQERRRMSKLLPPQQDFLSKSSSSSSTPNDEEEKQHQQQQQKEPKQPTFTLNVKRGASIPGAKLASVGMKRLADVTAGLQEDHRRVMADIIRRHEQTISYVDQGLLDVMGRSSTRPDWKDSSTTMTTSPPVPQRRSSHQLFTPPMDEAIDALGALASQFNDDGERNEQQSQTSQLFDDYSSPCVASPFQARSQSYYSQDASSDVLCTAIEDPFELSQRVERGDCVVDGPFENVEDFIDPETLAPFSDPEDADGEDDYLDGENNEVEMDEEKLECTLSILATQELGYHEPHNATTHHADTEYSSQGSLYSYMTAADTENKASDSDTDDSEVLVESFAEDINGVGDGRPMLLDNSNIVLTKSPTPDAATPWTWPHGDFDIQPSSPSPCRKDCSLFDGSVRLHPLHLGKGTIPWLVHVKKYNEVRNKLVDNNASNQRWFPPIPSGGINIELLQGPPCTEEVSLWARQKLRKRASSEANSENKSASKRKKADGAVTKEKGLASALYFDVNSRMLTRAPAEPNKSIHTGFELGAVKEVEQVEWTSSQLINLSLTQTSQNESASQNLEEGADPRDAPSKEATNEVAPNSLRSQSTTSCTFECDSLAKLDFTGVEIESPASYQPLGGIGNQGGRIQIEGGGGLKAKTRASQSEMVQQIADKPTSTGSPQSNLEYPTPLTVLSIEIHVQCRTGRAGVNDSKEIAMTPNSDRDRIFAIVYAYGLDPGGGDVLQVKEFGCLFVPVETENAHLETATQAPASNRAHRILSSLPRRIMGVSSKFLVESVRDERQLLLRLASIVRRKDPDMLVSWDTQGAGLGYLIERGVAMGKGGNISSGLETDSSATSLKTEIDMARLLSRTPTATKPTSNATIAKTLFNQETNPEKPSMETNSSKGNQKWIGSGLGGDWDDRVGPGAAAASITGRLVFAGWKIVAEEVKHANASYLQAMVDTVLNKRIPYHDNLTLTRWYGAEQGRERWRTLYHKLTQATATLLLIDALDIIGRAGEAARLSGVEFSQSFPGIRGSQYKVEGVLLRALQSLHSDERGEKKGRNKTALPEDVNGSVIAIDGGSSLSNESKSQTQSPWRMRRKRALARAARSCLEEDDKDEKVLHDLAGRNYFFFSPSLTDANKQEALEVQALTLEPQSGHQTDPVVVCDFTALYPSLVIAYNLCYSTCFGKLDYQSTRREMRQQGRTTGKLGPILYPESRTATVLMHHMKSLQSYSTKKDQAPLKDRAYSAPNGALFVSEAVLKGVLPQVLDEILSTRAMLKKAAKEYQRSVPNLSPSILRQLEARQLALKYVANVTYGYTSATFSGRCAMPILADTIVECGRRTLTNAINMANQWGRDKNGKWHGCEVIYGDTDSVFVKLPGRSVQEGFAFGEAFCKAVTASNPPPVQLKLEKVYHGSIMQTKKKYCGMKYESKDQVKPMFEAKGIETVRRDQCALTQKILRNTLITLFQERGDLTQVKSYLERQWQLVLAGRLPVADFILTGRVRSRYRGGRVGPVQAVLARRLAEADPGRIVRHSERLPYVIVATPGRNFRLRDCVLTPMELLEQWDAYRIHSVYYITKHVNAALQRCLGLEPHCVNVQSWYEACPKPRRRLHMWPMTRAGSSLMISSYFGSDLCSLCGQVCKAQGSTRATVCSACRARPAQATQVAWSYWNQTQHAAKEVAQRCNSCNLCFEDSTTFATLKPITTTTAVAATAVHQKKTTTIRNTKSSMKANNSWTAASRSSNPGIVVPLANCTCIDCPTTFERHRLREAELEAEAACQALDLF